MKAFVSSNGETVVIPLSSSKYLTYAHGETRELTPSQVAFLLGGEGSNGYFGEVDSAREAKKSAKRLKARRFALDLLIMCMDRQLSSGLRRKAVAGLDKLLQGRDRDWLYNVAFTQGPPPSLSVSLALELATVIGARHSESMFRELLLSLDHISRVDLAWRSIIQNADTEAVDNFRAVLVGKHFYSQHARLLASGKSARHLLVDLLLDPDIAGTALANVLARGWPEALGESFVGGVVHPEHDEEDWKRENGRRPKRPQFNADRIQRQLSGIRATIEHGDFARLEQYLDELAEYQGQVSNTSYLSKSLCNLAMTAKEIGNYDTQLYLTARAVKVDSGDAWAWAQHADALWRTRRYEEALDAAQSAELFGQRDLGLMIQGRVLARLGRDAEAVQVLARMNGASPDQLRAKASVQSSLGMHREALATIEAGLETSPWHRDLLVERANTLNDLERFSVALDTFDGVLDTWPDDTVAQNGRANILKSQGDLHGALAAFEKLLEAQFNNNRARNGRATTLLLMNRLNEALEAFEQIMHDSPWDTIAPNGHAEALRSMGRFDEALAAYDAQIKRQPRDEYTRNARAHTLLIINRTDEALAAYEERLSEVPGDVVAATGRAETLKELGRFDEAIEAYDAILLRRPHEPYAANARANLLVSLNQLGDALKAYESSLASNPSNRVASHGRAETLRKMGRRAEALDCFEQLTHDFSFDSYSWNGRARTLAGLGRRGEALEIYEHAMSVSPWDIVARVGHAETLAALGRLDEALAEFAVALEERPGYLHALHGTASTLKSLGRYEDALAVYRELVNDYPHDEMARVRLVALQIVMGIVDEEAVAVGLDVTDPRTDAEWSSVAIAGLTYLKEDSVDDAVRLFDRGASVADDDYRRLFALCGVVAGFKVGRYDDPHIDGSNSTINHDQLVSVLHAHAAFGQNAADPLPEFVDIAQLGVLDESQLIDLEATWLMLAA